MLIGIYLIIQKVKISILYKSSLPQLYNCSVGLIGLGYVGLPLAIEIAKNDSCILKSKPIERIVFAYDINKIRINELNQGIDRNNIFSKNELINNKNITFTSDTELLRNIDVYIITVPTPITENKQPDLFFIKEASKLVALAIKKRTKKINPIIIFESTVYPGVTEEICVPIIEQISGRKYNDEYYNNSFFCGYSPERINPGDKQHTLSSIIKVTSGCNDNVANWIDSFYGSFIEAGTHKASTIKIAEAAKIIENTQRDINIALVNELSILFKKLDINTKEVLDAASTKWNFHKYMPGLVGGHCIGVDPYYLTYKAKEIGFDTKLISAGRNINDYMYKYLLEQILNHVKNNKVIEILLLGVSYKSNCGDIRNSQLINLIEEIKSRNFKITIVDPKVNKEEVARKTGLNILPSIPENKKFSIVIFALLHDEFKKITKDQLLYISNKDGRIFDLTHNFYGNGIINL